MSDMIVITDKTLIIPDEAPPVLKLERAEAECHWEQFNIENGFLHAAGSGEFKLSYLTPDDNDFSSLSFDELLEALEQAADGIQIPDREQALLLKSPVELTEEVSDELTVSMPELFDISCTLISPRAVELQMEFHLGTSPCEQASPANPEELPRFEETKGQACEEEEQPEYSAEELPEAIPCAYAENPAPAKDSCDKPTVPAPEEEDCNDKSEAEELIGEQIYEEPAEEPCREPEEEIAENEICESADGQYAAEENMNDCIEEPCDEAEKPAPPTQSAQKTPQCRPRFAAQRRDAFRTDAQKGIKSSYSLKFYRVREGDSLWSIAEKMQVAAAELSRMNGLGDGELQPGMLLSIPC